MRNLKTRNTLVSAFQDVNLNLTGLFELYDADPEMVEEVAVALRTVQKIHLMKCTPSARERRRMAMKNLLDPVRTGAHRESDRTEKYYREKVLTNE